MPSFLQTLIRNAHSINWHHGRGTITLVTLDAGPDAVTSENTHTGTITREIPVTQYTRRQETRRFTVKNNTLHFLGHRRKIA